MAGDLEGLLETDGSKKGAVLCHPHPLYGGSMDDMVLQSLNAVLRSNGFDTLRFNFRGVGASEGVHDDGTGEVDDVFAAIKYLCDTDHDLVVLAGYSFGAAMSLKAVAADEGAVNRLVLVAPPVQMIAGLDNPGVPALVILGDDDQIVDASRAEAFFQGHHVEKIAGADHFFFGAHDKITEIVSAAGI